MRIVQVIDSLEVGGAEKMAVNYANALSKKIKFSGLVATRAEGDLKNQLQKEVSYLFLNRKMVFDFKALLTLRNYCKEHKVDYLQPHSSSFFIVFLVKIIYPKIKIIWHDHNGLSEFISTQKSYVLKIASYFFNGIIVVNYKLKNWAEKELYCSKVEYLPNFTSQNPNINEETILNGIDGKRILCLANLRDQKNHYMVLEVAEKIRISNPEWTFHLVGKDFEDGYSAQIKDLIQSKKLQDTVYIYGSKNDISAIIKQSDIAILTSKSEGLPVSLLEYGLMKKPVVVTNVGEIPHIIHDGINGSIVDVSDVDGFIEKLLKLLHDATLRTDFGIKLYQTILENHSEEAIIIKYLKWVEKL